MSTRCAPHCHWRVRPCTNQLPHDERCNNECLLCARVWIRNVTRAFLQDIHFCVENAVIPPSPSSFIGGWKALRPSKKEKKKQVLASIRYTPVVRIPPGEHCWKLRLI